MPLLIRNIDRGLTNRPKGHTNITMSITASIDNYRPDGNHFFCAKQKTKTQKMRPRRPLVLYCFFFFFLLFLIDEVADSFQTRFWKGCGSVLVHCWWLESLIFYFYAAKTVPYSLSKARCLTSTETIRLIRDGEKGGRGYGGGGKSEIIYLSLHCHHKNDFCIKMGSGESHVNVLLIVRDKVTRQCPQTTTMDEKGEPKRIRTEVPLLTSLTPYR